jgi:hypothetical protein
MRGQTPGRARERLSSPRRPIHVFPALVSTGRRVSGPAGSKEVGAQSKRERRQVFRECDRCLVSTLGVGTREVFRQCDRCLVPTPRVGTRVRDSRCRFGSAHSRRSVERAVATPSVATRELSHQSDASCSLAPLGDTRGIPTVRSMTCSHAPRGDTRLGRSASDQRCPFTQERRTRRRHAERGNEGVEPTERRLLFPRSAWRHAFATLGVGSTLPTEAGASNAPSPRRAWQRGK